MADNQQPDDPYKPVVLCVDDDYDTVEMLKILFEERRYGFRWASTCADALQIIREGGVSAVLMDNKLPDGSGIDVCQKVREFNKELPIVFFSGAHQDCGLALRAGANAFLTKPCTLNELFGTLAGFFGDDRPGR
jgi:DNA-binding response OmpR family regulator